MDLITQLQNLAQQQTSLADGLRQKREALSQAFNKFYENTQPNDMWNANGIPLQPSRVMSAETSLRGAFQKALSPYSPELELTARNNAANIIADLLKIEQNNQSGTSVDDLLKTRKELNDAGFDTSSIDNIISSSGIKQAKETEDPAVKAYIEQFKNGSLTKITEVPAADRSKVVKALADQGINIRDIQKKNTGKKVASSLKVLYNLYTGNDSWGGNPDLDYGRIGGNVAKFASWFGLKPNVKIYNQTRKGLAATIKKLAGESGVLTDYDTRRLLGLIPSVTDNEVEAKKQWNAVNDFLKEKFGISIFNENNGLDIDQLMKEAGIGE